MKRLIKIVIIFSMFIITSCSQYVYKWNAGNIKYETPEKLRKYRTSSKYVYGRDNVRYAVDVEVVPLFDQSDKFRADIKYAAQEIASDMEIMNIKSGDFIPKVKYGYYVVGQDIDTDSTLYPVIIGAIIKDSYDISYEITIDCYDKNIDTGISIIKSFEIF